MLIVSRSLDRICNMGSPINYKNRNISIFFAQWEERVRQELQIGWVCCLILLSAKFKDTDYEKQGKVGGRASLHLLLWWNWDQNLACISIWFLRKPISPPCYFASGIRVSNKFQICVYIPMSLTNAGCMVLSESRRTFTSETPNSVDAKELAVVLLCRTFVKI